MFFTCGPNEAMVVSGKNPGAEQGDVGGRLSDVPGEDGG
uniref:Flotillin 1 n=1 Tax=Homo sapiens TaxID=9606 RepID=A2AB09_HUMAN